jgi:hypothetical protein
MNLQATNKYHLSMRTDMNKKTGIVIPVYLPDQIEISLGEKLLTENVDLCCAQVTDPSTVCLSVDGEENGADVAKRLEAKFGVSTFVSAENGGKFRAVKAGMLQLLKREDLAYLAIIDMDGDHFGNELLSFVRVAWHIESELGTDRVLVLGRRISRHRPLGFLRGELEELAERILLDALSYRSVVAGRPLHLEYVTTLGEFLDVHSGYKLFSRATARDVFTSEPQLAGVSKDGYYRHACEAVMAVEAVEHGACLGTVNRTAVNEQPISTFGLMNLSQLSANLIIWPCKRLEIPPSFVKQWMANHLPRLKLQTLLPEGRDELKRVTTLVWDAFGIEGDTDVHFPPFV